MMCAGLGSTASIMSSVFLHEYATRAECLEQLTQALTAQLQADLAATQTVGLLLPGGQTPQALYPLLNQAPLPWLRIQVSLTDERWVAREHAQSNLAALQARLSGAQCLDPRQAAQPHTSATAWAQQIQAWPLLSAVLLGMGEDGHIASLFPGMPDAADALDASASPGALVSMQGTQTRLSLNLAQFLRAHWLGLLMFGDTKRRVLDAVLEQGGLAQTPIAALLLQNARPVHVFWAP